MNNNEMAILVERLFTLFRRNVTKTELDEWAKQLRRFNYRADDISSAIDNVFADSPRMPTLKEFRTAIMAVSTDRTTQSGHPAPKPDWLVRAENEWRTEDFEWWNARFGSLAPQAKALIGEACSKGKARLSLSIAKLINDMHRENLPFLDRWERLKAQTAGTTYTITPSSKVAASTFEDF
jgi:hypothetical protein